MKLTAGQALFGIGLCAFSLPSCAEDLIIDFSGVLVAPTCELIIENAEQTVVLGEYNKRELLGMERTAGKPFHIDIQTCPTASKVSLVFKGLEASQLPGALAVGGDASGIAIAIESTAGEQIKINSDTIEYVVVGGASERLSFNAYLLPLQGQTITAGQFSSFVSFELTYP